MLRFTCDHPNILAGELFDTGEHEVAKPSKELLLHAGGAHAAGTIVVTEGLDDTHIQSQEDGEAANAAALGEWVEGGYGPDGRALESRWSGPWHDGNRAQGALQEAQAALAVARQAQDEAVTQAESDKADEAVAAAEAQLADAEKQIATLMGGEA